MVLGNTTDAVLSISISSTEIGSITLSPDHSTAMPLVPYILLVLSNGVVGPLGFIGSILIIFVMNTPSFPPSSFRIFLIAIAFFDSFQLAPSIIKVCVYLLIGNSPWFCKIFYVTGIYGTMGSAMSVTAVSVDRLLAVSVPHKIKAWCTPVKAKITVAIIMSIGFAISWQSLWTWTGDSSTSECYQVQQYITISKTFGTLYLVINIVCFCIILLNSIIIGYKLRKQSQTMAKFQPATDQDSQRKRDAQIIAMLIGIAVLFISTSLPMWALFLSDSIFNWSASSKHNEDIYQVRQCSAIY